jgi:hypothetical protein
MDELEREVRTMFKNKAAGMPREYDANPELARAAGRRRSMKLTGLGASMVAVIVVGVAVGVGATQSSHPSVAIRPTETTMKPVTATTTTTEHSLPPKLLDTTECQLLFGAGVPPKVRPVPPRLPPGDAKAVAHMHYFVAQIGDVKPYEYQSVLAPDGWSCSGSVGADTAARWGMSPPGSSAQPITAGADWLYHGDVSTSTVCSVFVDPPMVQYLRRAYPTEHCAVPRSRTVIRLNAHAATFTDANGDRGAGYVLYPTTDPGNDGAVAVLTCRPGAFITAAQCDAIVHDFADRVS